MEMMSEQGLDPVMEENSHASASSAQHHSTINDEEPSQADGDLPPMVPLRDLTSKKRNKRKFSEPSLGQSLKMKASNKSLASAGKQHDQEVAGKASN